MHKKQIGLFRFNQTKTEIGRDNAKRENVNGIEWLLYSREKLGMKNAN